MAKTKDETHMKVEPVVETPKPPPTPTPPPPAIEDDTATKELAFELLWSAMRTTKGYTHKRIVANFERFRRWVGVTRAEEMERHWRGQK